MREKSGSFNPLFEAKSLLLLPQKMPLSSTFSVIFDCEMYIVILKLIPIQGFQMQRNVL